MRADQSFETARVKIATLNRKLKPIAEQPVDPNDTQWEERMRNGPKPLDQAGVRAEAEAVLKTILDAYAAGDAPMRTSIRQLIAENRAFAWATGVPIPATTEQGFRQHLLWLSAIDQAQDLRDTILTIHELCRTATAAGVDTAPIVAEVAELSSDEASLVGSLKTILQRCAGAKR